MKMNLYHLDHEYLVNTLSYDPDTGIFVWKKRLSNRAMPGKIAGYIRKGSRYTIISIGRKFFYAHRLAWFYVHGEWPECTIDHIDRNPGNNSIKNLRKAEHSQNAVNKGVRKTSTVGLKGVWRTSSGRFASYVGPASNRIRVGLFDTAEEAHAAYVVAAKKMYGEFAGE